MSDAVPRERRSGRMFVGLAVLIAASWLAVLPLRPLFNPDEGRYAEIPREMLAGGDWVIPHLNGLAYLEKPPLQYWATALALAVFGTNEFAARLYTALCALGTIAMVWVTARRWWGDAGAWRAAALLASSLMFVVLGQLLTLDMSLTFYLTVALGAFLLAQADEAVAGAGGAGAGSGAGRPWMLTAWIAVALGVLTKGLVAAAIPAAVLVLYSTLTRDLSPWRRLHWRLGLPLFLVVALPWHWFAARRMPDFLQFYFVHEHFARYLTPSADRQQAWWFFGAVFLAGSFPWNLSALRVLATGWRRRAPRGTFDAQVFLWIWIVFVIGFFSLSDSKLMPYILPVMPAVALSIAALPGGAIKRDLLVTVAATVAVAAALLAASLILPERLPPTERGHDFALLARPLGVIVAVLTIGATAALWRRRRDVSEATVWLGAGWCLSVLLLMRAAGLVAPIYSGIVLARAGTAAGLGGGGRVAVAAPLYSVDTYDQTLPFYWQRTVTLVAYRGELDFGLQHNPGAWIPTVGQFVDQWKSAPAGFAVMEISMFDDLEKRGVPMRELARDVHRVLVMRQ